MADIMELDIKLIWDYKMTQLKIPDTITEEEVKKLIASAKKNKIKLAIALGFYQGMRVTEVISLSKDNVDNSFIHIKEGKGCKDRDIPIQEPARFYLRYLPVGVTRQALHKSIKKLGKKVINKDIHFHTLRHSGASYYLNEKRIDIRFIQQFLGHSRLSTTQIYTHVNPIQLKSAFENAWR